MTAITRMKRISGNFLFPRIVGAVAAWRVLRGKEADPETAVSAADLVRTQRRSCMLLQRRAPVGAHVFQMWIHAILCSTFTLMFICGRYNCVANIDIRYIPINKRFNTA
jgi:hypothetical protein